MKRLLVIADTHCGSLSGLTPPGYQVSESERSETRRKFHEWQVKTWDWFAAEVDKCRPFDALVWNGDAIDGLGERSGGTELMTTDRLEQVAIARAIYDYIKPPYCDMIYGTPYHTGKAEDFERILADDIGAHIGAHEWIEADGVVIDFKHKVSGSIIPHGRHTAPSRSRLWNALWAERDMQPKAQLIVRSHAHYYDFSGDATGAAIITPALQGWTKYGAKECEGTIDYGFITIDCDKGAYSWTPHLMNLRFAAARARIL